MDVSVVIPLFDKGPYIARAVQSALRQTVAPRQIIIVDDGSTDDGPSTVKSINDRRIRLIQQANAGVSAARNNGIIACESAWVALLDADDEWKPGFLERACREVDHQPDVICVGTDFLDAHGRSMVGTSEAGGDFFARSTGRGVPALCSSAVVIRRDALIAAGLFPIGCHAMEDIDMWMRLAWMGKIAFVNEPLAVYHTDVVGSASKRNRLSELKQPILLETYVEWERVGRIPEHLRANSAAFARDWLFRYVRQLIFDGRGAEARSILERFKTLAAGDGPTVRKLISRSRVPQAIPATSRFLKSLIGAYRKPEFL
jgi:glycosyltransferase involved in cell wall biosynthesis